MGFVHDICTKLAVLVKGSGEWIAKQQEEGNNSERVKGEKQEYGSSWSEKVAKWRQVMIVKGLQNRKIKCADFGKLLCVLKVRK